MALLIGMIICTFVCFMTYFRINATLFGVGYSADLFFFVSLQRHNIFIIILIALHTFANNLKVLAS